MAHPIQELQTKIVAALAADIALTDIIGINGIFDLPPKGKSGSYLVLGPHDVLSRDADIALGNEHRLQIRGWTPQPNRADALMLAERVVSVLTSTDLSSALLKVTHVHHRRTDSAVDLKTGRANANISFLVHSEPSI